MGNSVTIVTIHYSYTTLLHTIATLRYSYMGNSLLACYTLLYGVVAPVGPSRCHRLPSSGRWRPCNVQGTLLAGWRALPPEPCTIRTCLSLKFTMRSRELAMHQAESCLCLKMGVPRTSRCLSDLSGWQQQLLWRYMPAFFPSWILSNDASSRATAGTL